MPFKDRFAVSRKWDKYLWPEVAGGEVTHAFAVPGFCLENLSIWMGSRSRRALQAEGSTVLLPRNHWCGFCVEHYRKLNAVLFFFFSCQMQELRCLQATQSNSGIETHSWNPSGGRSCGTYPEHTHCVSFPSCIPKDCHEYNSTTAVILLMVPPPQKGR